MTDVLPDLLRPGLKLVICGSAAGRESARQGAYYAHPQNRFWPVLAETGLTPHQLAPADYPTLLQFGIGLTDITKTELGADADLSSHDRERLHAAIARNRPRLLAFNGKRAASLALRHPSASLVYGQQQLRLGDTALFVLPSTSPLAVRWWDVRPWQALADAVDAPR